MDRQIFLDTDITIGILKNNDEIRKKMSAYQDERFAVSVLTVFELFLRKTKLYEIDNLVASLDIFDFDEISARQAAIIYKELEARGQLIPFNDLFIAAICMTKNGILWTNNKKHFKRIRGLALLQ